MVTFDSFLNAVIPIVVVVVMLYLLYRPLKEPLSGLWNLIKKGFGRVRGNKDEENMLNVPTYDRLEYD